MPLDAVNEIANIIADQTPTVFDPSVGDTLSGVSAPPVHLPPLDVKDEEPIPEGAPTPPPDPLGGVDADMMRDYQTGGFLNGLWKVFSTTDKIRKKSVEWIATHEKLAPLVAKILEWLSKTPDGGG